MLFYGVFSTTMGASPMYRLLFVIRDQATHGKIFIFQRRAHWYLGMMYLISRGASMKRRKKYAAYTRPIYPEESCDVG